MRKVLSLAVGLSIMATSLAWADSLVLQQPVKLSDGELGAERGGAPSPTERADAAISGAQSSGQSSAPPAAAAGAGAILNNGIGGPLGGSGGLRTMLGGQITSGSRSFGQ
jgi:hypothetical protein